MNSSLPSAPRCIRPCDKLLPRFQTKGSFGILALLLFMAGFARSADTTWTAGSATDLLWSTSGNWDLGIPGVGSDVFLPKPFPNPGSLANPNIITLASGSVANSITFFAPYTLTGGDLALTSGQVAVTIGNASTIESKLTGSGGLLKLNDGALKLTNAANDYTGTTQIDSGSVIITDQGALGTDMSAVVVTGNVTRSVGGGSLVIGSANNNLDGMTFTRDLALTGGGASGDGTAFNSVGNNIFTGNIVTGGNAAGLNPIGGTAITVSATRLASTFGTATLNGSLTVEPSGQSTEFTGNGNWIVNSNIDGAGNVTKSGNGLLILNGNNNYGGVLTVNGGFVRVSDPTNLGTSTATNAVDMTAGTLEIRSDTFTTATKVRLNSNSTIFVDRAIGGTGLGGTVQFGALSLVANRTLTINNRNGYGLTFSGNMGGGSLAANNTINNNADGLVTYAGTFWNQTNTSVRTFSLGGNGDSLITGNILASGAAHNITKTGTGTLTIQGTGSTFTGSTNVNGGAVAINDFRALNNTVTGGAINIGTTTTTATLAIVGNNLTGANVTTNKVINLAGTTGGAIILANQTGTSPGVRINSNFNATGGTSGNAKTVVLGGDNAQDNTIVGIIPNNNAGGTVNLRKIDSGTWVLAGANTYTGTTFISNGILKLEANAASSSILGATNAVTFEINNGNGGGTLELVGQPGVNNVQALGTLSYASGGASTIKLTPGLLGTASLTFANIGTGAAGTINFVGGDFTNNTITISQVNAAAGSNGILTRSVYWNGADFAYRDATVLRAPVYGVDPGTATSSTALTAGQHNEITGSFTTPAGNLSISTLKINGAQTLTLNPAQTLTISAFGLLATGGSSTITGGTALTVGGANVLVTRVDGGADTLRIETVLSGFTGGLTKSGAGTLVLAGANTQTGTISLNEGTIRLATGGSLSGGINNTLSIRQGATLDLNGVDTGTAIDDFNNNGAVINSSAGPATLTVGNNNGAGTSFGIIDQTNGVINVTKTGTGAHTWNGISTYTGVTTIDSTGILTITNIADIGNASGIGKGDATSNATNAASLVFTGASSTQAYGGLSYNGRTSVSTDRLFTFGGTAADSGVRIQSSGGGLSSTLVFSNTGALAFGTPNIDQGLALGGGSTGDNQFNPQITDNGTGVVSLYKQAASLWILGNNANSYTGRTQIDGGQLRADGAEVPVASTIVLNGGVLQTSGSFTRSLTAVPAAGAGGVNWLGNGGFAASASPLTVNIGGNLTPDTLQWTTGGFVSGTLILSSGTSLAEVNLINSIDLFGADRTIQVDTNSTTNSDLATLSGVISNSTGTAGIVKSGSGILRILADNTYNGDTTITGGTVRLVNIGDSTSTSSNFGTGAGKVSLNNATLAYVGGGETTDRLIELGGSTQNALIESSGSGALVLTNVVNVGTGARNFYLRGDLNAANEITSALADGGGALSVVKDDNGTWILSGQSTFTGSMTLSAGPLGISEDSVGPVGAVTSSPVGVTRLIISNGSLFALDGDRTLNTLVRFNANATANFIGINSITLNALEGTTSGNNTTITNSLPTGKLLTLNAAAGTFTGTEATSARTIVFNGGGDTIMNASITDSTGGAQINLTYQGYGSLTLGGSNGASTYRGPTTISSGTLKVGSTDAIPNGVGKGDVTMNPGAGLTATLDLNGFDQTVNGLIANSAGTANIDNSSATPVTFTFGSQDQAANLIGGVTNSGGGALSLVKTGTAAATMIQGPFTYTGSTTVNGGSLTISSDVNGTTAISVGAGAFLAFTEGLSGSALVTSINVGAGGDLRFLNSAGEPLSGLTSLTLGAGSTLGLNAGATSDTLTLASPNIASVGGAVALRIRDTGSMLGGTTYNLLEAASGGLTTGGSSAGSYSLVAIPGGFTTLTLNQTDTLVSLTTGTLVSDKRYWTGASDNVWNTVNGAFDGLNWSPDKSGATVSSFIPGSGTTVVFSADNVLTGPNLVTTMEQGLRINALEFESGINPVTSVTINPGTDVTNRLIISPSLSTEGINLKSGGPGVVTISAPLRIDVDQTWTVADSTSTLTVSGGLSGPGALTIDGPGTTIVSAAAGGTFAVPTVLVNNGTLRTEDIGALGTTVIGNAAAITINPGGAFYYNGPTNTVTTAVNNALTLAGGTLSAGGSTSNHYYTGAVNLTADSFINLRDSNSATVSTASTNIILNGAVTGTGKVTLDSSNGLSGGNQLNGVLYLQADNSGWSGGFDITRGTIQVQHLDGFGTGDVTASAGRIQFNMPANNIVNLAQNFTVDAPGGILELSVDAGGTLSGDLAINLNGVITLGSNANANNALRITQSSDNFSILNIPNSVVLGNDASISYQGNAVRSFEITGVISETGGSRSLAINDELYAWGVTSRTVRLSGNNTFSGDLSLTEGALEFSTVSNIGGAASNLGKGSGITLAGGTFSFVGDTISQSTNRPINQTGAATFAANGTNGATITYSGPVSSAGNSITLTGTGEGTFSGAVVQTGTSADVNLNSGIWHFSGVGSTIADDVFVNATSTGTAVLELDTTGTLSWTAGTSNGLYIRNGGVVNLNADDVNGVANSGNMSYILLGFDTTGDPGTLNTNTFKIETPRLDLGSAVPNRAGIIVGTGTVTSNYAGTDYAQGFRVYDGSISANLAGQATLLKSGVGTVTLSGDNSGLIATVANTRVDAGTLILDYTTSNTTKLSSNRAVDMRGSTIQIVGNDGAATTETFNNLTLASGGSSKIQVIDGAGQTAVLNLGTITRGNTAADGTMRFILPSGVQDASNGITTTSANSTSGLLGSGATPTNDSAYATVDNGSGVWFARNSNDIGLGNVVALISTAKDDVTTWLPGDHITDATGFSGALLCASINSLRLDAATGSDIGMPDGGILTVSSGGILITDNVGNSPSIQGGTLTSGATEIIITQDSVATFEISADIRVNHALTKTGAGTLLLTGNNVYTDETEIQEGILQVNGTSIGDTSPVNLADDHVATLQLLNSEAIGRLTGGVNTAGLDTLATVDIGDFTLTINSGIGNATFSGKLVGSGILIKNNSGSNTNQNFNGANTDFNGMVIVNGGLFQLSNIGSMNATDYTINSGGSLLIDNNSTTSTGARILDTATITLNSADGAWSGETKPSGLAIRRDQPSAQNETVGVITVRSGASYSRLDVTSTSTSASTQIIATNIVRQNNATLDVRGTNLGDASGRRALLRIGDATNQTAFIAAMVGGGSASGTNQSIVPWMIAEDVSNAGVGDGNMGNSLATYTAGRGFRALDLTTDYATIAGGTATDNVREDLNADLIGIAGKTVNALVINNNATAVINVTGSGAGQTLVNTSGAFLFTVNGANNNAFSTVLGGFDDGITVGGTNEYVFTVQNPSSVAATATLAASVTSNLTSVADITKSGRGALILSGTNTAGGGSNRTTLNEGILEIANLGNIGGSTGDLVFAGGTLRLGAGLTDDISQRNIILLNAGGTIDTNGVDLTLANSAGSGLGGLTKTGTGILTLNGGSTYSGPTVVSAGTLVIGANDATGTGDLGVTAGATLDLGTNSITAGLVTTSGASPAITGTGTINASSGFYFNNTGDITVDAVLAGGGGLLKTQTNGLTLTGLNTYTGTTEVQNGTVSFDSIANVGAGASALGAPATVEDGIIRMGLTTADPILIYTGTGHSTDRIIEMQGVAGGNLTIKSDGTGALGLGTIQTAVGGDKTVTLGGDSTGFDNLTGTIKEVGGALTLQKTGAGTWLVNLAPSYTGDTQVDEGTLKIGFTNALPIGTALRVGNGATAGTLDLNGFDQIVGALSVSTNSVVEVNNIIIGAADTLTVNGPVVIGANANLSTTLFSPTGGGSFVNNNDGGTFQVGGATGTGNENDATADFSALSNFTVDLGSTGTFRVGDNSSNTGAVGLSKLILAPTSTITANSLQVASVQTNSLQTLQLGSGVNTLNVNKLQVGGNTRGVGLLDFAVGTGTLKLRAADATSAAVMDVGVSTTGTANSLTATVDLTDHDADLLVTSLTLADRSAGTGATTATMSLNEGHLVADTLVLARRTGTGTGNAAATLNLGDGVAAGVATTAIGSVTMAVNTSSGGAVSANFNITGGDVTIGTGSGTAINMANAGAGRSVDANIDLSGGNVTVSGNIIRTGGAGTENATVILNGSHLDMSGNSIGSSVSPILLSAQSGSLTNLAGLNSGGTLTKSSPDILTLGNGNTFTGGVNVAEGTLLANNTTGSATGSGTVSVDAGTILGGDGIIAPGADELIIVDGDLIVGLPTAVAGSDLALTTSGSGSTTLNGKVGFDIFSGAGAGDNTLDLSAADRLILSGPVTLGGSLSITDPNSLTAWTDGDKWKLFDWALSGAPTGEFSNLMGLPTVGNFADLPDLSPTLAWDVSDLYVGGTISVVTVPEPGRLLLLMMGLLGMIRRRRRRC